MAVRAAGHAEDRLLHQQQRRGEIQAAGEGKPGAAEDHPGGEASRVTTYRQIHKIHVRMQVYTKTLYICMCRHIQSSRRVGTVCFTYCTSST